MKSKTKKRVLKIAVVLAVMLFLYFTALQLLLRTSMGTECHIRNFYREPKNTLDVAVIGCSEMYADFSPPIAYDHSGFTSYNLAYEGAPGRFYNSMLTEFLSRQDPQLVVFEVNGFFYNQEYCEREGSRRKWLDNMDMNANWAELIRSEIPREEQLSYYLRMIKYHSNWERPEGQMKRAYNLLLNNKYDVSMMKSFGTRTTNRSKKIVKRKGAPRFNDYGRKQFADTLAFCQEQGLENVLFIHAPHQDHLEEDTEKELYDAITAAGYDYIDLDDYADEIGIDMETDFYNRDHLNVFGNEKCTKYLADYITENYDINTDHSEKTDKQWEQCAEYTLNAFEVLKQRTLDNEDAAYSEFTDMTEEGKTRRDNYQKRKSKKLEEGDPEFIEEAEAENEDMAPEDQIVINK